MKASSKAIFEQLFTRYPALECCREDVEQAALAIIEAYSRDKKLLVCGNGGSAADSDHIVGELMKGFLLKRPLPAELAGQLEKDHPAFGAELAKQLQRPLMAISLVQHNALSSAFANDVEPQAGFAQQVLGYGRPGDILVGISTSGNSKNVVYACAVAKSTGLVTIAMTGAKESDLSRLCRITIRVPAEETFMIQEYHLPVYHCLCAMAENEFFG